MSPAHWVTRPKPNPVGDGGGPFHSRPRRKWRCDNPWNTVPLTNTPETGFPFLCMLLSSVRRRVEVQSSSGPWASEGGWVGHCNCSCYCHTDHSSHMWLRRAWSLFICPDSDVYTCVVGLLSPWTKHKGPQTFEWKVVGFVEMPFHWPCFISGQAEPCYQAETTELLRP